MRIIFPLLILMSLLLNSCFFYKEVKITNIRNVELVKFENNAIIIEADVDVFNPNFYDIEVVDSQLKIYLDGDILGNAKILNNLRVDAKDSSEKHLKIRTVYKGKLSSSLKGIFGLALGKEMNIKIEGILKGKAMGLTHEYPLHLEQEISL